MLDTAPIHDDTTVTDTDVAAPAEPQVPPVVVQTAARTTRSRSKSAAPAKPRARSPRKKRGPTATEIAAVEELRKELASAREELVVARLEVSEVVAACREAEARVATTRADAAAARRLLAEIDATATAVRGVAEAAQAEVGRADEQSALTEQRIERMRAWLDESRSTFGQLQEEARRTLDQFRSTVDELRPALSERAAANIVEPAEAAAAVPAVRRTDVVVLTPAQRALDSQERLAHLLNDAWGTEKEYAGLLQTLADESGDTVVRDVLEHHRENARRRQDALHARLVALGVNPASERGLLGQLVTRLWDAVRAPRDSGGRAIQAALKGVSASEFQASLSLTLQECAALLGDTEIAELAEAHAREQSDEGARLRAALPSVVGRVVRR